MTPVIQDNPSGWGPCAVPEQFRDMPYQPFSKGDRLGKVADWTGATYQDKRYTNKYSSQFGGGSQYAYFHEEDETSFQLVDTARTQKTAYQRNRMRFAQRNLRRDKDRRNMLQFNLQTLPKSAKQKERERIRLQKKFQKQFGVRQKWDQKSQKPRDSSVEVRSDWEVKEEMDFPQLMKMRYLEVSEPQDIECCGALEYYDKAFDRITTRSEKPLRSIKRIFHTVTTTDDPVIRKLAKTQGNVFATDAILATLMSCTRSVYSWDIVVQRVGSKLFFDKRDNSDFDLLTVSETANEPPQDEGNSFNSPRNLAMEATYINHNFSQQCLRMGKERYNFPNPNPFVEDDMDKNEIASVAYRYRRWKLGDDIDLIVRCEHDGVMTGANGEVSFINIKTLNEWDSRHCNGVDWRQKLDSQRGAVIATELKNNSYKLARWTCCALLAGSEYLKLGYVSRYHVKDSSRHVILGTQQFKPNEFASQINLSVENAWGILRCVIDICMKLEEGKYLILKDPNKQVIRVYSLPDGTFSSDEDDEEEEEEEEEKEKSLIVEGKREKKKVERLTMQVSSLQREPFTIAQGKGQKLCEIERIHFFLSKKKTDELRNLHKLLYNRPGTVSSLKKNVGQFSGFPFEKGSIQYKKKEEMLKKFRNAMLKSICEVLDLERSGVNSELVKRILNFLMHPKPSGKPLPKSKKSSSKGNKKERNSSGMARKAKRTKCPEILSDESSSDEEEKKNKEESSEDEDKESEEEQPPKKTSKREKPKQKATPKSKKSVKGANVKKADSSTTKKNQNSSKKESESEDSSDDEPLIKKLKKPPTDEELKETVKKLLASANLEEVTMKQICKEVYENYPAYDLTERKEFIKTTVKELIS